MTVAGARSVDGVNAGGRVHLSVTRKLQLYPRSNPNSFVNIDDPRPYDAKNDYGANSGSYLPTKSVQPGNPNTKYDPAFDWSTVRGTINSAKTVKVNKVKTPEPWEPSTGVIFRASELSMASITDGASFTYLIGERYLCPDTYYKSECDNDQGWDEGYDWDINRWTAYGHLLPSDLTTLTAADLAPPKQDRVGLCGCMHNYGSAHPAGLNMAFCDGVVRKINYDIDPSVHAALGHRSDGEPTQLQALESH